MNRRGFLGRLTGMLAALPLAHGEKPKKQAAPAESASISSIIPRADSGSIGPIQGGIVWFPNTAASPSSCPDFYIVSWSAH